jgi:hypothetical protein
MPTGQNSAPLTDQLMEMPKGQQTAMLKEPMTGHHWVQQMGQTTETHSGPLTDLPTVR